MFWLSYIVRGGECIDAPAAVPLLPLFFLLLLLLMLEDVVGVSCFCFVVGIGAPMREAY